MLRKQRLLIIFFSIFSILTYSEKVELGGGVVTGEDGIAIGADAKDGRTRTPKTYGMAIGNKAENREAFGIAIGNEAITGFEFDGIPSSNGDGSISIGDKARSTNVSIALGHWASSKKEGIAIGFSSKSEEINSVSIGGFSEAKGNGSMALGYGAGTKWRDNVALGSWSRDENREYDDKGIITPYSNFNLRKSESMKDYMYMGVVSVGGVLNEENHPVFENHPVIIRHITNVADAVEGTDAVNLRQLRGLDEMKVNKDASNIEIDKWEEALSIGKGTIDGNADNKTVTGETVKSYVEKVLNGNADINEALKDIDSNKGGIASTVALASIPQVSSDKLFSIGLGASYYAKHGALALGLSGQNKTKDMVYKLGLGVDFTGAFNVGAGINYSFGKISQKYDNKEVLNIDENIVKELQELKSSNEKLQKSNKEILKDNQELKNNGKKLEDIVLKQNEKISKQEKEIELLKELVNKVLEKNTVEKRIEKKVNINNFESNGYSLKESHKRIIDKELKNISYEKELTIIGYADIKGDYKYNLKLAYNRANAVKEYLEEKGYNNMIVKSTGFNTIVSDKDDAKNRRVEILVK